MPSWKLKLKPMLPWKFNVTNKLFSLDICSNCVKLERYSSEFAVREQHLRRGNKRKISSGHNSRKWKNHRDVRCSKLVTINLGHERNSFLLSRWWHGLQALNLNESLLSCQAGCPRENRRFILGCCVHTHVVARVSSATCLIGRSFRRGLAHFSRRWSWRRGGERIFLLDVTWKFLWFLRYEAIILILLTLLETKAALKKWHRTGLNACGKIDKKRVSLRSVNWNNWQYLTVLVKHIIIKFFTLTLYTSYIVFH